MDSALIYLSSSVLFIFSFIFLFGAVAAAVSGTSYWRPNIVNRKDNWLIFWFSIFVYAILGIAFLTMGIAIFWDL